MTLRRSVSGQRPSHGRGAIGVRARRRQLELAAARGAFIDFASDRHALESGLVTTGQRWFNNPIIYSLSVERFFAENGGGHGDLAGLERRLGSSGGWATSRRPVPTRLAAADQPLAATRLRLRLRFDHGSGVVELRS